MEKALWFKRKKYGWGWTPANAMGWLVLIIYVILISAYPLISVLGQFSFSIVVFLIITFLLTGILFWICFKKGEKPSWSWGGKNIS